MAGLLDDIVHWAQVDIGPVGVSDTQYSALSFHSYLLIWLQPLIKPLRYIVVPIVEDHAEKVAPMAHDFVVYAPI